VGEGTAARPLVHQRSGKSWVTHTLPRIGADARLAGIVAAAGGRATAVGGIVRNGIRPLVLTYDGTEWRRDAVLVDGPGVVLTAIEGDATSWVTGWRIGSTTVDPLLLRRTPDGWGEEPLPSGSGVIGSLLDLAQPVEGLPWIVGTGYFSAPSNLAPLVSRFGGSAWSPYVVPWHGGWYLSDIAGDPQVDGWVLGKATRNGPERGNLLSRVCEVSPGAARRSRTRIRANGEERAHGRTVGDHQHGDLTIAVRHRPIPGLKAVPALPRPTASDRVRLRDVATSVGLDGQQVTYGAWVGDLDDNGQKDIVLSRHGQALGVFVRGPGGYQELPRAGFPASDRHGCAVAPLDEGALGDIVCSTGGQEGVGLTTFELILDPASGARDDLGTERGISDPTARGRLVVALDADSDGDLDLYLGNVDTRYDGLPSVNRLLLNDGQGSFSWAAQSGLTGSYSVEDAAARDIDRDGDPDLVVTLNAKAPRGPGVRIFRNDQGTFTEVARSLGVRTIGDLQADVVQLGGNRRPDLVQMAEGRLRISLWKDGAYRVVYERRLTDGRGFAVGDADGDGANDIYLLLGRVNGNRDDVLLLNDGTGRRWTPVKVPSVSGGAPAGVVAFDHNGDQRSDFLVLNGVRAPGGRIQLLVSSTP
jgi:hypothetical protein